MRLHLKRKWKYSSFIFIIIAFTLIFFSTTNQSSSLINSKSTAERSVSGKLEMVSHDSTKISSSYNLTVFREILFFIRIHGTNNEYISIHYQNYNKIQKLIRTGFNHLQLVKNPGIQQTKRSQVNLNINYGWRIK